MRRVVPALILTAVGLGALASFHAAPQTHIQHIAATAPPLPPTTDPATVPPTTSAPPRSTKPPASAPPPTQAPTTTTPPVSNAVRTVDGDPFDNQYGTVQVRVTLQGNRITGVTALQMPYDHQRSAYISQQAEPYLQQEALSAQSANIDIISGATYTSQSYAQSLQSALDKAHG
jgi:uncharacterized protein with FMN-binding domain